MHCSRSLKLSDDGVIQCVELIAEHNPLSKPFFEIKTTTYSKLVLLLSSGERWKNKTQFCWVPWSS
jgi:hypothetical protein